MSKWDGNKVQVTVLWVTALSMAIKMLHQPIILPPTLQIYSSCNGSSLAQSNKWQMKPYCNLYQNRTFGSISIFFIDFQGKKKWTFYFCKWFLIPVDKTETGTTTWQNSKQNFKNLHITRQVPSTGGKSLKCKKGFSLLFSLDFVYLHLSFAFVAFYFLLVFVAYFFNLAISSVLQPIPPAFGLLRKF